MSNKTKEEIEQLAESVYGTDIDSIRGSKHYDLEGDRKNGFIKGYTQCQETLNSRIVELEKQLESLINLADEMGNDLIYQERFLDDGFESVAKFYNYKQSLTLKKP